MFAEAFYKGLGSIAIKAEHFLCLLALLLFSTAIRSFATSDLTVMRLH
jgi:hypothetical protein